MYIPRENHLHSIARAQQSVDDTGLTLGRSGYSFSIAGLFEWRDKHYVLINPRRRDAPFSPAQTQGMLLLANVFESQGRHTGIVSGVVEMYEGQKSVNLGLCPAESIYDARTKEFTICERGIVVREALDAYRARYNEYPTLVFDQSHKVVLKTMKKIDARTLRRLAESGLLTFDFGDLRIGYKEFPTDIDRIIVIENKYVILIELKTGNAECPTGQKIALMRMASVLEQGGLKSLAVICSHNKYDPSQTVVLKDCVVREFFDPAYGQWYKPFNRHETVEQSIARKVHRKETESA